MVVYTTVCNCFCILFGFVLEIEMIHQGMCRKFSSDLTSPSKRPPKLAYLFDRILCGLAACERNERIATIRARHRIHHQSQIPNRSALLEQRNQLIFEHVLGYFAAEHFATVARRAGIPIGRRASVFALACTDAIIRHIQKHAANADRLKLSTSPITYRLSHPACSPFAPESA